MTVSTVVVALVTYAKWSGVPDEQGSHWVLALAFVGVGVWAYSKGNFSRETAFDYLAGYIAVVTSAAGVFGFTRRYRGSLTATKEPPSDPGLMTRESGAARLGLVVFVLACVIGGAGLVCAVLGIDPASRAVAAERARLRAEAYEEGVGDGLRLATALEHPCKASTLPPELAR
jgi:hypothetical protein